MSEENQAAADAEAAKPSKRATRTPGQAPADAAPAVVAEPEGLPNAIDIDAHAITSPVLTRQGWVCPADKPNPAARR
jgi:hypothetical protein